ncbi:MAG: NUMOD1 domain-containing DNA-binding protein [Acutalibacteraceae bacterium]|nr:NUMOD1 domain-containing DNA-binding protein [Acutalibacteraceae bacterium]
MSNCEKAVLCMLNTGEIVEYKSAKEASQLLGLSLTGIRDCLRGARTTTKGYRFEYGTLMDYKENKGVYFETKEPLRVKKRVPVVVFNPDTTVFGYFKNASEAARAINSTVSAIRDCANGKNNTVNGFVVKECTNIEFKAKLAKYEIPEKHGKNFPVVQVNMRGKEIARFNNVNDAANSSEHFERSAISKCLTGRLETAYGFKWMYLDTYIFSTKG